MDTELYIHRSSSNNNNSLPAVANKKRWSISVTSNTSSLERLDEEEAPGAPSSLRPPLPPPGSAGGRRKSWHVGRLDYRKRRKASAGGSQDEPHQRQKRHSWWTVFLPDHFSSRSRRSSTDVGRTTDQIPWVRSKSRSVDHGFVAPFDLDSLRNKIEGRIESIDRLNKDGDGYQGSKESLTDSSKMHKSLPPKTTTYKVEANDTLTSIAAHFDTTPSELAILNRLASRTVFPGQVIRVPEKRASAAPPGSGGGGDTVSAEGGGAGEDAGERTAEDALSETDKTEEETAILDKLRVASPKPGHVERISSPQSPLTGATRNKALERFLKICVRHITDGQGVVSGVLLVTPNAVMFDPNVSDPLVIEQGPESYGVIAPMEYVVNAAIYHDIAHMRVGNSDRARPDLPKPEVYHAKSEETIFHSLDEAETEASLLTANQGDSLDSGDPHHSPSAREDSLLAKDETFPELRLSMVSRSSTDEEGEEEEEEGEVDIDDNESCGPIPRDGAAFPKAFERDLVTPTNLITSTDKLEEDTPTIGEGDETEGELEMDFAKSLEERRKSSLDHHWAVPSKPHSLEDRDQEGSLAGVTNRGGDPVVSSGQLVKSSCLHDSGIDIREPPPSATATPHPAAPAGTTACFPPRKTVYSDADVLLAPRDEFVPPIAIAPPPQCAGVGAERKKTSSVSFSLEEEQQQTQQPAQMRERSDAEMKKSKMKKRLSYPLSWMEGIVGEGKEEGGSSSSLPSSADSHTPSSQGTTSQTSSSHSHSSVFSKVFSRRSSVGTFIRQQNQQPPLSAGATTTTNQKSAVPKLDYRSMVSVDDMPELFASFDKLIPRPAKCFEDPPLYLRLRMGKPLNKKIPKSTPVMSYGKKKMRPEYWFSVPRERVDDLYRFLTLWVPHLYGDLVEEAVHERGYELVESDTELWESEDVGGSGGSGGLKDVSRQGSSDDEVGDLRESWEVLSMSEELRRALYASSAASLDLDLSLPDLNGVTEILTEDHRKQLCRHLPARAEGYVWTLVFSTSQHGFSLNSMYRKMNRIESPILLVIQDTDSNVFGGLTSCALKVSEHFYGTGESLLYTFTPEFHVYNWTGDNMYFIKGNNESLSIGAGDGKFGLWLDGDLNQGRTEACNTYGNDPLTPTKDFVIKTLECWAFV